MTAKEILNKMKTLLSSDEKVELASIVTAEGDSVFADAFEVGNVVQDVDGNAVGEGEIKLEDGSSIVTDAEGKITEVKPAEGDSGEVVAKEDETDLETVLEVGSEFLLEGEKVDAGEYTVGDKIYVVDADSVITEIKDVVAAEEDPAVTLSAMDERFVEFEKSLMAKLTEMLETTKTELSEQNVETTPRQDDVVENKVDYSKLSAAEKIIYKINKQ